MKAGSGATRSDQIAHRLIRSLRCAPFPAFIYKIRHGDALERIRNWFGQGESEPQPEGCESNGTIRNLPVAALNVCGESRPCQFEIRSKVGHSRLSLKLINSHAKHEQA